MLLEPPPGAGIVDLSLLSHTNVGKTTLARTLLRRDIGEIRDQPHVTEIAEAHVLIDTPRGDALHLWDTPGFGDSARLLRRLRTSANPMGWLLTQVWDRFTDRPFYSSQQALRNARQESDVILYLVNAAEDPASAGYVDTEMQILGWIDKPVLLLLNQMGSPRGADLDAVDESAWRRHLARYPWVRGAIGLDAFARCWVQEDELLEAVGAVLPAGKADAYARLRDAWRARNLGVFADSMSVLSNQLAAIAVDRERLDASSFKDKAGRWLSSLVSDDTGRPDAKAERAMTALATRHDAAVREATDRLIALHGLSGRSAGRILSLDAQNFAVSRPADVGTSGVIGGLVSGAVSGIAADLAAGGLTFGAGALIGGALGALGAGGAAKAYNLARGARDGRAAWSSAFLTQHFSAALLRYLAVAHFGRGRGDWVEGEYAMPWRAIVEEATAAVQHELEASWRRADDGASRDELQRLLQPTITASARSVLVRLYPKVARLHLW